MRTILFYTDIMSDQGGAQRVLSNLIEHYFSLGYKVILVTDYPISCKTYNDNLFSKIDCFHLDSSNRIAVVRNFKRIKKLNKIIKKYKVDYAISFLGGPNLRLALTSRSTKTKKIISVRSDPNIEYGKRKIIRKIVNVLFGRIDGIVLQTKYASSYFSEQNLKKTKIILNPVSEAFYEKQRSPIQKNIVAFGSLLECKNHKMIIDSFDQIKHLFPDDNLLIYGRGYLYNFLLDYIKQKHLESRVFLMGNVDNVCDILLKSKIFVLASNYEGLPNSLMEALATGTPVISTDCPCGGPKYLIQDHDCGLLVKCNSPEELSNGLMLLKEKKTRERFSKNARERAQFFRSSVIFKEWDEYLTYLKE